MAVGRRSLGRAKERLWLALAAFRATLQRDIIAPSGKNKLARNFALTWILAVGMLILLTGLQTRALRSFYLEKVGQPGGTYSEGIVGSISTVNPILADTGANADAAKLVFSGLTHYNAQGKIEGDLAKSWTVSPDGRVYTFALRPNVQWQDGKPMTSSDVAFTIGLIQTPDTRSPMASAWQGVVVSTPDAQTVVVTLPVRYDAFLNSTTVGILPQHLLKDVRAADLRVANFNQAPVGTGPFRLTSFDTESGAVTLQANAYYFGGKPQLDSMTLKVYASQDALQSAFRKHQINGMARVANSNAKSFSGDVAVHTLTIPEEVGLFMRTKSNALSAQPVRAAISAALDRTKLTQTVLHGSATPLTVPALATQVEAAAKYPVQAANVVAAKKLLDDAGWKQNGSGTRARQGDSLNLKLVTAQTADYQAVAAELSKQLASIGIKLDVEAVDVATLQKAYLQPRDYDMLLYGINAGVDLDPYPYWHSSQAASPGLNVSQYASPAADKALESARSTTDPKVRQVRLASFLDTWTKDVPAAMLYTPKYLYVTRDEVRGIQTSQLVSPDDRFYDVQHWTIRTDMAPRR